MDSLITAAARGLASGDALGALKLVGLRNDAPALAPRGIAMAQLGDIVLAKAALKKAVQAFGPRETLARARCVLALAELALVSRDLNWSAKALAGARTTLEARSDRLNAAHARIIEARRLLLIGSLCEAGQILDALDARALPPTLETSRQLVVAGLAIRRLQTAEARAALERAKSAARAAGINALDMEVEHAWRALREPAARLIAGGEERLLVLDDVASLMRSDVPVIDACRNVVRHAGAVVSLATRPVLFALARTLGEAWPGDASRETLIARAFRGKSADESHRARLRVEMGRLRAALGAIAAVNATRRGFVLRPHGASKLAVIAPVVEDADAAVLALLADGEAWASSALALALGTGPRTLQRALERLARDGKVQSYGRGSACRWMMTPVPGFPTSLLLPGSLVNG